jgi:hypothetical protein
MRAQALVAAAQRAGLPIEHRQARLETPSVHLDIFFQRHDS